VSSDPGSVNIRPTPAFVLSEDDGHVTHRPILLNPISALKNFATRKRLIFSGR
jgi:hypothetical protein